MKNVKFNVNGQTITLTEVINYPYLESDLLSEAFFLLVERELRANIEDDDVTEDDVVDGVLTTMLNDLRENPNNLKHFLSGLQRVTEEDKKVVNVVKWYRVILTLMAISGCSVDDAVEAVNNAK